MPDDDKKPETSAEPPYKTAAELFNIGNDSPPPTPGLSFSPGLVEITGSKAPAMADGTMVSHVMGPGQAPVDPIAAGLDTQHKPLTRNENRVVTQTGEMGAGPRPTTYAGKGVDVPQAAPSDGSMVAMPKDAEADASPGPNSAAP